MTPEIKTSVENTRDFFGNFLYKNEDLKEV
jgi:hypothetical protein